VWVSFLAVSITSGLFMRKSCCCGTCVRKRLPVGTLGFGKLNWVMISAGLRRSMKA
jgi:hypothetical protein